MLPEDTPLCQGPLFAGWLRCDNEWAGCSHTCLWAPRDAGRSGDWAMAKRSSQEIQAIQES